MAQTTRQLETLSQNLIHTRCVCVGKLMSNAISHYAANPFEDLRTVDQFLFGDRESDSDAM